MGTHKPEIITFKANRALMDALKGVRNRSEFIRSAILTALESCCPLCKGTGVLSLEQRKHWDAFATGHSVEECRQCHELHLVCEYGPSVDSHAE